MKEGTFSLRMPEELINYCGIKIDQKVAQQMQRRLDTLSEKCPYPCDINLVFEKRESCFIGKLEIKAAALKICSRKISHIPYQVFSLLVDDIENQLLDWKRQRFSNELEMSLNPSFSYGRQVR